MTEWIKCSNRLPTERIRCLIYVPDHDPSVYQDAYGQPTSEDKWMFVHEAIFPGSKVEAWMPLPPEPPK